MKKKVLSVTLVFALLLTSCAGIQKNTKTEYPASEEPKISVDTPVDETTPSESEAELPESEEPTPEVPTLEDPTTEEPIPEEPIPPEPTFDIVLTFAGDCMLASLMGQESANNFIGTANREEPGYFLSEVQEYFGTDDFTIVNLENVFTDDPELTEREKEEEIAYWYRSSTKNAAILAAGSVEAVSTANNHSGDYGKKGARDTEEALRQYHILYGTKSETLYLEKNGFRIAVICGGLWKEGYEKALIRRVKQASAESDFQIVYYHGGTEKIHEPEEWKINSSHALVDGGADLVIGNHPHVLQPREIYKNTEILYSLGNFCYGGASRPENRTILYQYTITVDTETLAILNTVSNIVPCYVYTGSRNNFQPAVILDETDRQHVLDFMDGKRDTPK